MSLSADQVTQVFEILGVPQDGVGATFEHLATRFGPEFESFDLSAVVTHITTKLNALTTSQLDRVTPLLTRWDALTSTSPLQVLTASGSAGTLADYPAERAQIRASLSNILGIYVPKGGFAAETARVLGAGSVTR
jgi:hypothetical protein